MDKREREQAPKTVHAKVGVEVDEKARDDMEFCVNALIELLSEGDGDDVAGIEALAQSLAAPEQVPAQPDAFSTFRIMSELGRAYGFGKKKE